MELWEALRWLHLVAMGFFVGGQVMLAAVVVPVARSDRAALRAMARRFGWGTLAAIAVLVATGIPLASHFSQWENGTLHVKLALVGVSRSSSDGTCAALSGVRSTARSSSARCGSSGSASASRTELPLDPDPQRARRGSRRHAPER